MKSLACLMLALLPLYGSAANPWLPVKDVSLKIVPGSILDFTALAPPAVAISAPLIVTADGDYAVQNAPTKPRRFLMMSMGMGVATGGFPDKPTIDEYVKQMRLHGYNMARLHFVDETLMTNMKTDFGFNPTQLDRFYYLLASLKRAGIYYVLDGMSSDSAGYGNIPDRYAAKVQGKLRVFYDPVMQQHWRDLVSKLYGAVNPYTGISTLADPALGGLILVNEGGLAFILKASNAPTEVQKKFGVWLKNKYGSTAKLKAAWGAELKANETLEAGNVIASNNNSANGKRTADSQRFYVDLEKDTADWMTAHLRKAGYKGLVTAYDTWVSPGAAASRNQFSWVDMHSYYSEPSNFVSPGSVMRQDSMLATGLVYLSDLSLSRPNRRAFTVSEYGQVFWNKYRRETALAFPAYASFQNWSMIAQHALGFTLAYDEPGGRKSSIYPYVIGPDPVLRAGETLSALLFLRGDVAPAQKRLRLRLDPWYTYEGNGFYGAVSQDVKRLTWVHGIGVDYQAVDKNYDAQLLPYNSDITVFAPTNANAALARATVAAPVTVAAPSLEANLTVDQLFNNRITVLRKAGILAQNARDNTVSGVFLSDTGELALDRNRRRMTVVTPQTEAAVFDVLESVPLTNVRIDNPTGPALLSVSAMDGASLNKSKRMLVVLATDARNTGMTFSDPGVDTTLKSLGTGPVTIQAVSVQVKLLNANAATLKVYSNKLSGARGDLIPVKREAGSISFTLDTATLSHGPTTYFEIATQ